MTDVFRLIVIHKILCPKYHYLIITVNTYGRHWLRP